MVFIMVFIIDAFKINEHKTIIFSFKELGIMLYIKHQSIIVFITKLKLLNAFCFCIECRFYHFMVSPTTYSCCSWIKHNSYSLSIRY